MKAYCSFQKHNTKFAPVLYWMMYNCISETIKVAHIIFSAYEFLHFRISATKETKSQHLLVTAEYTQQQLHSILV